MRTQGAELLVVLLALAAAVAVAGLPVTGSIAMWRSTPASCRGWRSMTCSAVARS